MKTFKELKETNWMMRHGGIPGESTSTYDKWKHVDQWKKHVEGIHGKVSYHKDGVWERAKNQKGYEVGSFSHYNNSSSTKKNIVEDTTSSPPTNTDAGIAPSISDPPVSPRNKYKKQNEKDTKNMRKMIGTVNVENDS